MLIYKILRSDEWAFLRENGETAGAPIDIQDGYVHFSTAVQAAETAQKHFAGVHGLVLLAINTLGLAEDLRWEISRGEQLFPHLFRALRMTDVEWVADLPFVDGMHQFPSSLSGHVDPARAQFDAFKTLDRDAPIEMLNLVKFREHAAYPASPPPKDAPVSGAAAYEAYGNQSAPVLAKVGGRILWRGTYQTTLIGPDDETWDAMFIVHYPSAHAFLAMISDPAYKAAVVHRQAAVLTSRLIRTAPAPISEKFS